MAKYTFNDFKIGDEVYHLSNTKLIMVAVELNPDLNEISCRWVDKDGKVQCIEFMAEELGKSSDLASTISFL